MEIKQETHDIRRALDSIVGKHEMLMAQNAVFVNCAAPLAPTSKLTTTNTQNVQNAHWHAEFVALRQQNDVLRLENGQLKAMKDNASGWAESLKTTQSHNEQLKLDFAKLNAELSAVRIHNIDLKSRCDAFARSAESSAMSPRGGGGSVGGSVMVPTVYGQPSSMPGSFIPAQAPVPSVTIPTGVYAPQGPPIATQAGVLFSAVPSATTSFVPSPNRMVSSPVPSGTLTGALFNSALATPAGSVLMPPPLQGTVTTLAAGTTSFTAGMAPMSSGALKPAAPAPPRFASASAPRGLALSLGTAQVRAASNGPPLGLPPALASTATGISCARSSGLSLGTARVRAASNGPPMGQPTASAASTVAMSPRGQGLSLGTAAMRTASNSPSHGQPAFTSGSYVPCPPVLAPSVWAGAWAGAPTSTSRSTTPGRSSVSQAALPFQATVQPMPTTVSMVGGTAATLTAPSTLSTLPFSGTVPGAFTSPQMQMEVVQQPRMRGSITDALFQAVDRNNDGVISKAEFRQALKQDIVRASGNGAA